VPTRSPQPDTPGATTAAPSVDTRQIWGFSIVVACESHQVFGALDRDVAVAVGASLRQTVGLLS